jgi:Kef-type K+ transport system membrane component KefB
MALLMGLLLLAFLGSSVISKKGKTLGLPSRAEFLLLGFVLGPHALGLLDVRAVEAVDPVATVAIAWLALVVGLDFGYVGRRRVALARIGIGFVSTMVVGAGVAGGVYALVVRTTALRGPDALVLAGGVGTVCAQTTRTAVQGIAKRMRARGPLTELMLDLADTADFAPIVGTAVLFSLSHHPAATQGDTQTTMLLALPFYAWTGVTALLGVALGAAAAALLGNEFRRDESWGVLLGIGLAAAGLATRVGLSSLMTMFTMGLAISMISAHRRALSQMIAPTEQAVLLPLLLVAGARLDLTSFRSLPVLVIAAVALRLVFVLGVGTGLRHWVAAAKDVRSSLGLSLLPAGGISVGIGLLFSLRFPGAVGDTVLAAAAACTLLGEAVGTRALRGILETADEAFSADDTGAPPAVSMIPDRLSSVPELSREPSFPEASLETESPQSTSSLTGDDS